MISATDSRMAVAEPLELSLEHDGPPVDTEVMAGWLAERFPTVPSDILHRLAHHVRVRRFAGGSVLFREGSACHGVFLVRTGRVKLTFRTRRSQQFLLETAGPGEILGLGAAVAAKAHETTAEAMSPLEAIFIRRSDLLKFLREHSEACLEVIRILTGDLEAAYERVRSYRLR